MKFQKVKKVPTKIFTNAQLGWLTEGYTVCFQPRKGTIQWQKRVQFNTNSKKGTPLRFRAKKGHTGNEILVREKVPRNLRRFIFSNAQLGQLTKTYIFWPKKGTIQGQKRTQFNTNRKKGYTPKVQGQKSAHSRFVCRAEFEFEFMRCILF